MASKYLWRRSKEFRFEFTDLDNLCSMVAFMP